jgi:hypothetical protein
MTTADWLGALGVTTLLVAFLWNLSGRLDRDSPIYQGLNAVGAAMAGVAAALLPFYPFVVLESVWSLAAATALMRGFAGRRTPVESR